MPEHQNIYDANFVQDLFDSMAGTYGVVNLISSFGFTYFWRRQCVRGSGQLPDASSGYDLMSGMGEIWGQFLKHYPGVGKLTAIDFSDSMIQGSLAQKDRMKTDRIEIIQADALGESVAPDSADFIVCCFGLKTLSIAQREIFAGRVAAALRRGGRFSFLEISKPEAWLLRVFFLFYLKLIIPIIGRVFLGDPANYRMLGIYTEHFGDCRAFGDQLKARGLTVAYRSFFFGCATGLTGSKS